MGRNKQLSYAVVYYRVSTAEQGLSSPGLTAQESTVQAFARPGYQAALAKCRRMGALLIATRLDRITRQAHSVSALLEEGIRPRTAAMAQRERELISERTKAALAAAKARGVQRGGDRGYRPDMPLDARLASEARVRRADLAACQVLPLIDELREAGAGSLHQLATGLTERGVPTPPGAWGLDGHSGAPGLTAR
jgi:DNA invertase Pin-like site-specific DNA recombinase